MTKWGLTLYVQRSRWLKLLRVAAIKGEEAFWVQFFRWSHDTGKIEDLVARH
uniref:Uncharacterized protein n=1 Tax=Anguilla anguilla TaxID=7936 RepID=A0A0E9T5R3_ANGAN